MSEHQQDFNEGGVMEFDLARFEERREKAGFRSNSAFAEAIGINRALFTNLRKGKQTGVSLPVAEKIAKRLGTSTDYLFGLTDDPGRKKTRISPELALLTDEIAVLSPGRREDLGVIVEMLQRIDRTEAMWRESFMRLLDRLLDPTESAALATALDFVSRGDIGTAMKLVDGIIFDRNTKNSINKANE